MDRRSELPSVAAARTQRDLHLESAENRTEPPRRMPALNAEPTTWVFTKRLGFGRVAQPNESRLSCGATLKYSQMEFYHTARQTFSGSIGDGRRQLQALLGCAPQVIARVLPFRGDQGALTGAGLLAGL